MAGPVGQQLLAAVPAGSHDLRAAERLRRQFPADLVAGAFLQAELRVRAAAKFSRAADMLFTRDGLEQASAEMFARHRAGRLATGAQVVDLGCGIGGDLMALAERRSVLAVDRDLVHLRFARHNAAVYGRDDVRFLCADACRLDLEHFDVACVDPSRRRGGRRTGAVATEPPLAWCLGLTRRVPSVVVKAAPGLPRSQVPLGWQVEFVATGRELREAVLWSPRLADADPLPRATVLPQAVSLLATPGDPVPLSAPDRFLLDPSPAVTRAGAVQALGRAVGARQLDRRIAFLTVGTPVRTPFARVLEVTEAMPWRPRRVAAALRARGIGRVDIRVRGVGGDVEEIRRRLRLAGADQAVLVLTRVTDEPWALLCTEPSTAA